MYKGKKTLFYNGEVLVEVRDDIANYLIYDYEERQTWEVIIVLPGVEVIPCCTFYNCRNVKTVIMADTVRRIEDGDVFWLCGSLAFVRFSRNLEYIGNFAFLQCESLTSIFIPPTCRYVGEQAFDECSKLIILHVPNQTQLDVRAISCTALLKASPFASEIRTDYVNHTEEINQWVKDINQGDKFELHRACSSVNPLIEIIHGIVTRKGLHSFKEKNEIGMTPSDYLEANPFVENELIERVIMKRYVLEMMGETV